MNAPNLNRTGQDRAALKRAAEVLRELHDCMTWNDKRRLVSTPSNGKLGLRELAGAIEEVLETCFVPESYGTDHDEEPVSQDFIDAWHSLGVEDTQLVTGRKTIVAEVPAVANDDGETK